jgi:hypothetical protein
VSKENKIHILTLTLTYDRFLFHSETNTDWVKDFKSECQTLYTQWVTDVGTWWQRATLLPSRSKNIWKETPKGKTSDRRVLFGVSCLMFAKLPRPHCWLIKFTKKDFMKCWFHRVKLALKEFLCSRSFLPSVLPYSQTQGNVTWKATSIRWHLTHLLSVGD